MRYLYLKMSLELSKDDHIKNYVKINKKPMKDYRKPPIYQFFKILVTRIYMPNSSSIPTLALSKSTHRLQCSHSAKGVSLLVAITFKSRLCTNVVQGGQW